MGNEEKAAVIRQLGGTPINYKTENFAEVLKQQGGVDAVLDWSVPATSKVISTVFAKTDGYF